MEYTKDLLTTGPRGQVWTTQFFSLQVDSSEGGTGQVEDDTVSQLLGTGPLRTTKRIKILSSNYFNASRKRK